uniref:Uncharacterized protein LOC105121965 n=2 Tax=Rhizophora mucronata TaxID=61149 RepID=A0A2P2JSU0_RHIMU
MIALKTIQTTFTIPTNQTPFHNRRPLLIKNSVRCLCKSNDSESEDTPPPEGDTRKQELLARIAMLQTEKVRLTDYLDETSAYLTQFAEEANAEFDKVGEDALRGLDEASARIMENIEGRMQAFEESAELNRIEIEKNENKLAEFEGQIQKDRNEGLFFKNLGARESADKAKAKEEAEKIKDLTKEKAGSKIRMNIYLALIGLIIITIADSFFSSAPDWRKVSVLGAILVGLITQFSYEKRMASDLERIENENKEEERK